MNIAICPTKTSDELTTEYALTVISPGKALENETLLTEWRSVLNSGRTRYTMFMSPEWVGHVSRRSDSPVKIWLARNNRGELLGVVPVAPREFKLTYDVANRVLWKKKLRVAEVLGSQPCVPDDDRLLKSLFESILDSWPDCDGVLLDALPTDSFCSQTIRRSRDWAIPAFPYSPFDRRPSIVVPINATFDDYMRTKSPKTRSKLRKLRTFIDSGELRIDRYSQPSEADELAEGVSRVSALTWQSRLLGLKYRNDEGTREKFRDLASRGLLRSYLLWRDEQPLAYVVGYQYDEVYYYADIGFDPQAAQFSPGTVLLFMILEDLHDFSPPRVLNFGTGDAAYKQRFGETIGSDETLLLLRSGILNRLLAISHRAFMKALNGVKRMLGRRVSVNGMYDAKGSTRLSSDNSFIG